MVDAALMKLTRHVTLQIENPVTFKDVLDTRNDQDLKQIFLMAGVASKPTIAPASVSKAVEVWSHYLNAVFQGRRKRPWLR